jgi:formaldehyde-activating enzyme involved in methanogenesis
VEVRIGIHNTSRELTLDSTQTQGEIEQAVAAAVADDTGILTLADDKGRTVIVPARTLAYVELAGDGTRRVGFGVS